MLRGHQIPPSDQKQPSAEELKPVMAWLDDFAEKVDQADFEGSGPRDDAPG